MFLAILILASACSEGGGSSSSGVGSSSGGGGDSGGSSLVTVSVSTGTQEAQVRIRENSILIRGAIALNEFLTPKSATAAIPSSVNQIVFTISASDMDTMTKTVDVEGQTEITESFSLDNGDERRFMVEALDSAGTVIYSGSEVVDLDGSDISLSISMTSADTSAPYVVSTSPASSETSASVTAPITMTFSETVDPDSIILTLTSGTSSLPGMLTANGAVVQFTPSGALSYSSSYTVTVYAGVKDSAGNVMPNAYTWSFMTSANPDTSVPSVTAISPGKDAINVPLTTTINVTFSEPMDPSSITANSFLLYNVDTLSYVSGTVTYSGTTAVFTPSAQLMAGKKYMATITTAVRDIAGNYLMTAYSWYFTAGVSGAPSIITTYPPVGASNIASLIIVSATFSTAMDPTSLTTSSFTLKDGANNTVSGFVSYGVNNMVFFSPSSLLLYNTTYTATISSNVRSSSGVYLPASYTWTFTTEPQGATGALDTNFNSSGINTIAAWTNSVATSMAIQSDDRILIAGYAHNGSNNDMLLIRLNQDGTLDSSFGTSGMVKTDFFSLNDYAYDIKVQTDGKIVVAGQAYVSATNSNFALARYNSDGTLDTSFGTGGKATVNIGGGGLDYKARGIAIQTDGSIVVAGHDTSFNNYFGLVRYNFNGTLDSTFGTGGIRYDANLGGHSVIVQPDGGILVGGQTYDSANFKYAFALARYSSTGNPDASMGGAGRVLTNFSTCADELMGMVLLGDGTIVGAGNDSCGPYVALAKYTSTGALDTTFYSGVGKESYYVSAGNYYGNDIVMQADGKLVVAAASYSNPSSDFALVRFDANGFVDTSFDSASAGTAVFTDFSSSMDISYALAIQKDGKIVAAGLSGNNVGVARYWP